VKNTTVNAAMKRVSLDHVDVKAAMHAIAGALRAGLDPEADPPRAIADTPSGQILMMPASTARYAGIKVVTVTPHHDPRIQGVYILLDGESLTPIAMLDGIALTSVRTPAVSAVAVDRLASPHASRLVVFGNGPQARGHIDAIRRIRNISTVDVIGRDGDPSSVRNADIVCCCTTAREPLFDSRLLKEDATVVAVGSHEPGAREVDEHLVRRATVVVESRASALREAGDIIQAGLPAQRLTGLAELVRSDLTIAADQPRLFKSTGMAWEDLVVAALAYETASGIGWPAG
jgi:ornithine cyclodeaminase/alanine dehydrogenase-like protein (mu-crystallin family)